MIHYRTYKYMFTGIFLLLSFFSVAKTSFETGNALYKEKQYAKAITLYTKAIKEGDKHVAVYYNLANSYYRLKEFPKAVLYYEKALKLDPGNKAIEHNLKMAYDKSLTKMESSGEFFILKFIKVFVRDYSARNWAWAFIIFLWASTGCWLVYFRKNPGTGSLYLRTALCMAFIAVILFFIAKQRYTEQTTHTHAVVLQDKVELKAEPVAASASKAAIEAGNKVQLLDRDAGWYKIELPNGKQGWIDAKAIAVI